MWATMALAAALTTAPHQAGELKLSNVRATYWLLGPERKDNKYVVGDACYVTFDIENLNVRDDGKVLYSMKMEVLDRQGKLVFGKNPQDVEATNSLGGNRLPGFAFMEIGTDTAPGVYTMKLSVTDQRAKSKKAADLEYKFELLPKQFALVRVSYATVSTSPVPVPYTAVAGESIIVGGIILHFDRDQKTQQPSLGLQIRVLGEDGKEVAKPMKDEVIKLESVKLGHVPIGMPLSLNRPGKFTVELEATDRISKKTSKVSLPLEVLEQK